MTTIADRPGLRVPRREDAAPLPTWPLALAFVGYAVWWLFGAGWLVWPVTAVIMLNKLFQSGRFKVPGGYWIWLLFLASTFVSLLEVRGGSSVFSWAFNEVGYLSASVFFVYVYNMPRGPRALPRYLALLWMVTILGGLLGVFFPHAGFTTPMHAILPNAVTNNQLGLRFTDLHFGDISGYGNPRPTAPFAYANRWGSILALTTPMAVMVALRTRRNIRRSGIVALAVIALLPIVYSLDRGLWGGIAFAVIYALLRAMRRGQGKALVGMVFGVVALGILVVASSLHELAINKITNPYSNGGRSDSYAATWAGFKDQPWIGHGVTGSSTGDFTRGKVPVGTQGQFWTAIYTGGLLAAIPFFLWFIYVLVKTIHVSSNLAAVYRIACFLPIPLSLIYGFVPESLMVIMACQGALMRLQLDDPTPPRARRNTIAGAMHRLPSSPLAPANRPVPDEIPALTDTIVEDVPPSPPAPPRHPAVPTSEQLRNFGKRPSASRRRPPNAQWPNTPPDGPTGRPR